MATTKEQVKLNRQLRREQRQALKADKREALSAIPKDIPIQERIPQINAITEQFSERRVDEGIQRRLEGRSGLINQKVTEFRENTRANDKIRAEEIAARTPKEKVENFKEGVLKAQEFADRFVNEQPIPLEEQVPGGPTTKKAGAQGFASEVVVRPVSIIQKTLVDAVNLQRVKNGKDPIDNSAFERGEANFLDTKARSLQDIFGESKESLDKSDVATPLEGFAIPIFAVGGTIAFEGPLGAGGDAISLSRKLIKEGVETTTERGMVKFLRDNFPNASDEWIVRTAKDATPASNPDDFLKAITRDVSQGVQEGGVGAVDDVIDGVARASDEVADDLGLAAQKQTDEAVVARNLDESTNQITLDTDTVTQQLSKRAALESANMDDIFDAQIQERIGQDVSVRETAIAKQEAATAVRDFSIEKSQSNIKELDQKIVQLEEEIIAKVEGSGFREAKVRGLTIQRNAAQAQLLRETANITKQRMAKVIQTPAKNIKKFIDDNIVNKTELERDMLVQRLKLEESQAQARGDLVSAQKYIDTINEIRLNTMDRIEDIEADIVKFDETTQSDVEDIYKRESAIDYSISKAGEAADRIALRAEGIEKEFGKLSKEELVLFHDMREAGTISKESPFYEINVEVTKMTKDINDVFEKFDLLNERFDETRYMRTFLENSDGTPASKSSINDLRADSQRDGNASLGELLGKPSNINQALKNERKYLTADDRDVALEKYGLRTIRDPQITVIQHANESMKVVDKLVMSDTLRQVAVSGKKADEIRELYNPVDLKKFREDISIAIKKDTAKVLDIAKQRKVLSADSVRSLKDTFRGLTSFDPSEDIQSLLSGDPQEIDVVFDDILRQLQYSESEFKQEVVGKIGDLKQNYKNQLIDKYKELADGADKLNEGGFKDLTGKGKMRGAQGLFARQSDRPDILSPYDYIVNQSNDLHKNNVGRLLDKATSKLKLVQATMDIFLGVAIYWDAAVHTNPVKAFGIVSRALMGSVDNISVERKAFLNQFIATKRQNVGDIEVLIERTGQDIKEQQDIIDKIEAGIGKGIAKVGSITGIKLKKAADKIIELNSRLERFQFEKLVDGVKYELLEILAAKLQKTKGIGEREAFIEAGKSIDSEIGLIDMVKLETRFPNLMGQGVKMGFRILAFAPTLLTSVLKRVYDFPKLFQGGARGAVARSKAWKKLLFGFASLTALNMALNEGKTTFQNDDPDRIFDLQVPFIKDEQGNPLYINILGRLFDAAKFIIHPGKTVKNKTSGLVGFGVQSLFPNYFQEKEGNIIGNAALDNLLPVPFQAEGIFKGIIGLLNKDDDQYGVPDSAASLAFTSLSEFIGAPSNFIPGASDKESTLNIFKRAVEGISEGDFSRYLNKGMLYRALTAGDKKERQDALQDRYDISSKSINSAEDFERVQSMDEADKEDFISNLSDTAKTRYKNWEIAKTRVAEGQEEINKVQLGILKDEAGIGGEPGNATQAELDSFNLMVRRLKEDELTEQATLRLDVAKESGLIDDDEYEALLGDVENQFLSDSQIKKKEFNSKLDRALEADLLTKEEHEELYKD